MDDLQKGLLLNSGGGGVNKKQVDDAASCGGAGGGCKRDSGGGDGGNSEGVEGAEEVEGADLAALTDFQYDSTGCGDFCMVLCRLCGMGLCACCAAFSS